VAIDTMAQIESHMLTRHYEGFMKKGLGRVKR
jgi:preprotein translocase subunit SecY